MAGEIESARRLAGRGVECDQAGAGRGPHVAAVVRHAVHLVGAGERAVLAQYLGGANDSALFAFGWLDVGGIECHRLLLKCGSYRRRGDNSSQSAAWRGGKKTAG